MFTQCYTHNDDAIMSTSYHTVYNVNTEMRHHASTHYLRCLKEDYSYLASLLYERVHYEYFHINEMVDVRYFC